MQSTVKVANFQTPKPTQPSKLVDILFILMIGLGFGALSMYWYMARHPQDIMRAQPHIIQLQNNTTDTTEQAKPAAKQQIIERLQA